MYLIFYSSNRDRIITSLAFFSSVIAALTPVYYQLGKPFSMDLFLMTLVVLYVCSLFGFYFFRFQLCPVLQMYNQSLIVSRYQRKTIPVKDVKLCEINRNKISIQYLENDQIKSLKVYILNETGNNWVLIKDGKMSF